MKSKSSSLTRRAFVKTGAAASASAFAFQYVPSTVWGANERVNVGCVGIGGKGNTDSRQTGVVEGAQLTALCDVADPSNHALERKGEPGAKNTRMAIVNENPDAKFYFDYREMIADHPDLRAALTTAPTLMPAGSGFLGMPWLGEASLILVPLVVQDRSHGLLVIAGSPAQGFSAEEVALAQSVALSGTRQKWWAFIFTRAEDNPPRCGSAEHAALFNKYASQRGKLPHTQVIDAIPCC